MRFSTSVETEENQEKEVPITSHLLGTQFGKSTLFNVFTKADVYAANQLFATLDTTTRRFLEVKIISFFLIL